VPGNPLVKRRTRRHSIRLVPLNIDLAHEFAPFCRSPTICVDQTLLIHILLRFSDMGSDLSEKPQNFCQNRSIKLPKIDRVLVDVKTIVRHALCG
jgi:hypothetical protein